jgi:exonuclease 3'-5' domain-containing protein 1
MSSTHSPSYTLCSTPTAVTNAVALLALSEYLVLDCEGKSIGTTDGILSLICIGTAHSENIFIFDALALTYAEPAIAPLLNLLKSNQVRKVVWDGRQDFLEIMDNYGISLGGVVDLQLAEVTSRSTVRGENDRKRLLRLSSGYLSYKLVKEKKKELNGIHLVIGLQKCLEQTQLENVIGKDSECVFSSYGFSTD